MGRGAVNYVKCQFYYRDQETTSAMSVGLSLLQIERHARGAASWIEVSLS